MTMTAPTHPGWRIQLAIHRAVRRDAGRLSAALADDHEAPAHAVEEYWRAAAAQLHHHHEFEDAVVWPLLAERLGDRVDALLARNTEEHQLMAAALDELDAALAARPLDRAAARAALGNAQAAIDLHLAHAERDVLPLISEGFTMEDVAFLQAEDAKTSAPAQFLPWMLDDAPAADYDFFTGAMPAPVRAQLETSWMPRRRAAVESLCSAGEEMEGP